MTSLRNLYQIKIVHVTQTNRNNVGACVQSLDMRLARAVENNKVDEVEALLNAGASPDACDSIVCY